MEIKEYSNEYEQEVIEMILNIQQKEFNVPVSIADQPDLLNVKDFYCNGLGNFWIALEEDRLIGSIALIDIQNGQSALRKMFVHKEFRGKEKAIGQRLLQFVIRWCREKKIREIYLGTFDKLIAAQRFYLKNGFTLIEQKDLPVLFPLMPVDNIFLKLIIHLNNTAYLND